MRLERAVGIAQRRQFPTEGRGRHGGLRRPTPGQPEARDGHAGSDYLQGLATGERRSVGSIHGPSITTGRRDARPSPKLVSTGPLLFPSAVLLFKRIFKFEKATVEQLEKRLTQRYVPGPAYPLQGDRALHGGRDYAAKIQNIPPPPAPGCW